jgi:hypothetical protein
MRRSSTVLRYLLVDSPRWLLKGWPHVGLKGQPHVAALSLGPLLKRFPLDWIKFAYVGGAKLKVGSVGAICTWSDDLNRQQIQETLGFGSIYHIESFKLTKFLESPCMVIQGVKVTREDVMKYIANKLGGAHLDPTRKTSSSLEQKYTLLDRVRAGLYLVGRDSIYYELLSIGRNLIESPEIRMLRCRLVAHLPPYYEL